MDATPRLVTYVPLGRWSAAAEPVMGFLVGDALVRPDDLFRLAGVRPRLDEPVRAVVAALSSHAYLDAAREALQWLAGADESALAQVSLGRDEAKLLAPVPRPNKVFALAGNYMEHIQESTQKNLQSTVSAADQATPRVFMKPPSVTVCGDGDPILLGSSSRSPDYEAEMALIIGRAGRFLDPDQAEKHVAAVTCFNDVSERELRIWERPETREWDKFFDWLNGKWFDNGAPMGPCAVPVEDLGDIHDLSIRLWLNGELKQDASTAQMIFRAGKIVSYISQICTLEPGDIIATGTPSGVGHAQGIRLKDGDVVAIELEGVGRLTNPVKQL